MGARHHALLFALSVFIASPIACSVCACTRRERTLYILPHFSGVVVGCPCEPGGVLSEEDRAGASRAGA